MDFYLLLNAGSGPACYLPWIRVLHYGVDKLAAITIPTNDVVHPGPRMSLVVMGLVDVRTMVLIQDQLGPMFAAPLRNPNGTLVEKHWAGG